MNKIFYLIFTTLIIAVIITFSHANANGIDTITACINPSGLIHVVREGDECGSNEIAVELQTSGAIGDLDTRLTNLEQRVSELEEAAAPQAYEVKCTEGEKIADVLAQIADTSGPVTITINGVCQESLTITRDNITLRGASSGDGLTPAPSGWYIINLKRARGFQIQNLSLTGGANGLVADSGATFDASDLHIRDASNSGVHLASEASGSLSNSIIENCGRGIVAWGSGTLYVHGGEVKNSTSFNVQAASSGYISLSGGVKVTGSTHHAVTASGGSIEINDAIVEDNHEGGVWAMDGASISIHGSNTHIRNNNGGVTAWASSVSIREGVEITDNKYNGIAVNFGGHVSLGGGVTVARNTHHGIIVSSNSTAMVNDSFIQENYNHGIEILAESYVFFGNEGNTIINNGQWGINCYQDPPSSSQIWGNPGTVTDNPSGQINCPGY